jgi:hypothetical protein
MRVFLAACLAVVVIATASYFAMNAAQRLSGVAYTTEGARIKQSWSYRRVAARVAPSGHGMATPETAIDGGEDCDISSTWRWIMIDFGGSANEAPTCS